MTQATLNNGSAEAFIVKYDQKREQLAELKAEVQALEQRAKLQGVELHRDETPLDALLEAAGIPPAKTIRELLDSDVSHNFIIDGIFAEGMTAVIAGASKGMKTSTAVDMSLSLAFANKFLGRFWIPEPKRVLVFSVESGEASIKETAERVIKAKALDDSVIQDQLHIHGEWIPRSGSKMDRRVLQKMIADYGSQVVILDPTYFIVDGDNQANQSKQGQELREIAAAVLDAGATPVFVDHVKLSSTNAKEFCPLELGDLSGAAKSAFFRQWLLLSRREKFDPNTPIHRLWMTYGGSHGRHGSWGVDIDESRDEADQRIWDVDVKAMTEVKEEAEIRREEREEEREQERDARRERRLMQHVNRLRIEYQRAGDKGLTKRHAYDGARLNTSNGKAALERLIDLDEVESCEVAYPNGRKFSGHRIRKTEH